MDVKGDVVYVVDVAYNVHVYVDGYVAMYVEVTVGNVVGCDVVVRCGSTDNGVVVVGVGV